MTGIGWAMLATFLVLLGGGVGTAVSVGLRGDDRSRGASLLGASASIAVIGLVGAVAVVAWNPGSGGMTRMMGGGGMGSMAAMMSGSAGGACPAQAVVEPSAVIQESRFCPEQLEVRVGTLVRWTNRDNVAHTVTSRGAPHFDSGTIAPGASWSHRFERPGTYSYYCALHPWMNARVDVVG